MATNVPFTDDGLCERQASESAAETGSDAGGGEAEGEVGGVYLRQREGEEWDCMNERAGITKSRRNAGGGKPEGETKRSAQCHTLPVQAGTQRSVCSGAETSSALFGECN